ncbi:hypothetical protein TWF696_009624 [Orbilia brochopaga]|uniref:Uncharacterized protein n=1 Tax=Orbilia brochopaga TaxID=3140254 RepID=A0AAV9UFQ3_9PEZI
MTNLIAPNENQSPPSEAPSHCSDGNGKHIRLPYSLRDGIELLELVDRYSPYKSQGLDSKLTWGAVVLRARALNCLVDTEMTGESLEEHLTALTDRVYGNGLEYLDEEYKFSFVHEVGGTEEQKLKRRYRALLSKVIQYWQLATFEEETRRFHQSADAPSDERPFDPHNLQPGGPSDVTIAEMWEQALVRIARERKPTWIAELEKRGIQRVGDLLSEEETSPDANNFEDLFLERVVFQLWDYLPPVSMNWQCRGIQYSDVTAALKERGRKAAWEARKSGEAVVESQGSVTGGSAAVCPSASVAGVTPATSPTTAAAPDDREGGQKGHQEEAKGSEVVPAEGRTAGSSKRKASEAAGGASRPVEKRVRTEERASSPVVAVGGAS